MPWATIHAEEVSIVVLCLKLFKVRSPFLLAVGLASLGLGAFSGWVSAVQAAVRHRDGRIAFIWTHGHASCGDIFTVDPSGSGLRRLTHGCPWHYSDVASSANGAQMVFVRGSLRGGGIYVMDADGSNLRLIIRSKWAENPSFSPNGEHVVFDEYSKRGRNYEVFTARSDGSVVRQLTHGSSAVQPVFSPDGKEIAFVRNYANVYTMHPDGSHVRQLTHLAQGYADFQPHFSPDGRRIVFVCGSNAGLSSPYAVCMMNANGSGQRSLTPFAQFAKSGFSPWNPAFSPNGRRIAFMAADSCRRGRKCPMRCHHVPKCSDPAPMFLYTMRRDGRGLMRIRRVGNNEDGIPTGVTWQPFP